MSAALSYATAIAEKTNAALTANKAIRDRARLEDELQAAMITIDRAVSEASERTTSAYLAMASCFILGIVVGIFIHGVA